MHAGAAGSGRTLQQSTTPPPSCIGWTSATSDGRCVYSSCSVGTSLTTAPNCFNCPGNDCDNGCDIEGELSAAVPESVPFISGFTDGCCSHDHCYSSTAFSQRQCDEAFLRDNLRACQSGSTAARALTFLLTPEPARLLTTCETYAHAYFIGVFSRATNSYALAQQVTRDHEQSAACSPPVLR